MCLCARRCTDTPATQPSHPYLDHPTAALRSRSGGAGADAKVGVRGGSIETRLGQGEGMWSSGELEGLSGRFVKPIQSTPLEAGHKEPDQTGREDEKRPLARRSRPSGRVRACVRRASR